MKRKVQMFPAFRGDARSLPGMYQVASTNPKALLTYVGKGWVSWANSLGFGTSERGLFTFIYLFPKGTTSAECEAQVPVLIDILKMKGAEFASELIVRQHMTAFGNCHQK